MCYLLKLLSYAETYQSDGIRSLFKTKVKDGTL